MGRYVGRRKKKEQRREKSGKSGGQCRRFMKENGVERKYKRISFNRAAKGAKVMIEVNKKVEISWYQLN
jgi:hypothetical protein